MSGQIFISYRREDASHPAGRLYDRLSARFPQNQIFMDVDNIPAGIDFVEAIQKSVSACDVLIAVIGKQWLTASDEEGRRRLDHPEDFVRLEIGTALKRGIRVIPVLVDRTVMPRADNLPEDLKLLVRRNAVEISHDRFRADSERLVGAVERALEDARVEAEQREREKKERFQAERLELERRQQEERERLQAEQRERERLEAQRREREGKEQAEAERHETEALGGMGADSRAPLSSRTPPKGGATNLKKPRRLLMVIAIGVVACLLGIGLFKATRSPSVLIGGSSSATPAPLAAAPNSPNPMPLASPASPNPKPPSPVSQPLLSPTPTPTAGDWAYYGERSPNNQTWSAKYFRKADGDADAVPQVGDVVAAQGQVNIRKGPAYRQGQFYYNEETTGEIVNRGEHLKVLEVRGPFPGNPPDREYPWLYFRFQRVGK